jgi:hypothetical protein
MTTIKPPLGLRPKLVVDDLRIEEIKRAIKRYTAMRLPLPLGWITEYNELAKINNYDKYLKK